MVFGFLWCMERSNQRAWAERMGAVMIFGIIVSAVVVNVTSAP